MKWLARNPGRESFGVLGARRVRSKTKAVGVILGWSYNISDEVTTAAMDVALP